MEASVCRHDDDGTFVVLFTSLPGDEGEWGVGGAGPTAGDEEEYDDDDEEEPSLYRDASGVLPASVNASTDGDREESDRSREPSSTMGLRSSRAASHRRVGRATGFAAPGALACTAPARGRIHRSLLFSPCKDLPASAAPFPPFLGKSRFLDRMEEAADCPPLPFPLPQASTSQAPADAPNRSSGGALGLLNRWLNGPVEATVESAGYTIAPLHSKYRGASQPAECLVTLVLKVDLGGWLSGSQPRFRSLRAAIGRSWVEPMLLSVLALRDRVEQERFAVRPFRQDFVAGYGESGLLPCCARRAAGRLCALLLCGPAAACREPMLAALPSPTFADRLPQQECWIMRSKPITPSSARPPRSSAS